MNPCPRCGEWNPADIHNCTPNLGVPTWRERCQTHPDHDGIVTDAMIRARMQEEIDDLRERLAAAGKTSDFALVEAYLCGANDRANHFPEGGKMGATLKQTLKVRATDHVRDATKMTDGAGQ